ncbi:MAG: Coenzyme F420 hydrogenase/dehydrogenase, beta subunit C-terminal domain [Tistlia sp.]|uniref:Coenzyme F420 hydrogenase/dehydrogenase, beta subunit C-terminal domain n=1 Tax=Tistlia sp. TaxID=3057121 RepID=UPI0034A5AB91
MIDQVIGGGYCIGCGACKAFAPESFEMVMSDLGCWQARRISIGGKADAVCPMTGVGADETQIAGQRFNSLPDHPEIGRYRACGVGWVADDESRLRGSSGGLITWLAERLLDQGLVDAFVHVRPASDAGIKGAPLFRFQISRSVEELRSGSKSHYYPVEMSEVLEEIKRVPGRYAIAAIPCFAKAVRLLARQDPDLSERVQFVVGLVCGHLKSRFFAELLGWQVGAAPDRLNGFDFRYKLPGQPASRYGFEARWLGDDGHPQVARAAMAEVLGGNWGLGFFKYEACDYCDDVLAECADVAIGDAWLPGYADDYRGTNVFVVRDPALHQLIEAGNAGGQLELESVGPELVAKSQAGGLRHRREGLAYRLALKDAAGKWRPRKRVPASLDVNKKRKRIYDHRTSLMHESKALFRLARERGDILVFKNGIASEVERYLTAYRSAQTAPLPVRAVRRAARIARRILGRVVG